MKPNEIRAAVVATIIADFLLRSYYSPRTLTCILSVAHKLKTNIKVLFIVLEKETRDEKDEKSNEIAKNFLFLQITSSEEYLYKESIYAKNREKK